MKILVINAGSSSIKYSLFKGEHFELLISGLVERINQPETFHHYQLASASGLKKNTTCLSIANHQQGLQFIFDQLKQWAILHVAKDLSIIAHRVVHGGEHFHQPVLIDDQVIEGIKEVNHLAPLHNPANLLGIELTQKLASDIPQVAVFDTAFHQSIPDYAYHYALPEMFYKQHAVRRYGFHGTSHAYVAQQAASYLQQPLQQVNLITLHLGNGGSVTAIKQGKSIDTSMGMTPLEGLVMGSRCGDIDPAIPFYLNRNLGLSHTEIDRILNQESGLKGLCGESDMRQIQNMAKSGHIQAQRALDVYCYRIKKYIGAYLAILGHVHAIVFTGGIGENSAVVREKTTEGLANLGIAVDPAINQKPIVDNITDISQTKSTLKTLVITTDEALEIAMQSVNCLNHSGQY